MTAAVRVASLERITLGFIPLIDCAVLVAAAECGFARSEGLRVELIRESSWANIRDRTLVGQFDVAHMLGPMTVASTLGIGHLRVPMVAPCALGLGGNAITVSVPLWDAMSAAGAVAGGGPAVQGAALRSAVAARDRQGLEPLTFAMVYPFSCHNYELRYWLAAAGIDPKRDVRLVVIPPPYLVDALRAGQIDGFCVGEPWSSIAVDAEVGVIALPVTAMWPLCPEKVLGCREDWAERHPDALAALVRAIHRAADWCERAENHGELARLLSEPRFVGAPAEVLARALDGQLILAAGATPTRVADFFVTAGSDATFPWVSHALWFYSQMVRWGQVEYSAVDVPAVAHTFRPDLYRRALATLDSDLPATDRKTERFFDGATFNPEELETYVALQSARGGNAR